MLLFRSGTKPVSFPPLGFRTRHPFFLFPTKEGSHPPFLPARWRNFPFFETLSNRFFSVSDVCLFPHNLFCPLVLAKRFLPRSCGLFFSDRPCCVSGKIDKHPFPYGLIGKVLLFFARVGSRPALFSSNPFPGAAVGTVSSLQNKTLYSLSL